MDTNNNTDETTATPAVETTSSPATETTATPAVETTASPTTATPAAASTTTTSSTTSSPQRRYNTDRKERTDDNRSTQGKEKRKYFRKKVCYFCKNGIDVIDYKDVKLLRRYMKESGKIIPKRLNGSCSKHQRVLAKAIKRSRNIALLPFETRY